MEESPQASPITLFISYSHDSSDHEERVLNLSNRLRKDGIDVSLDQYENDLPEGWPAWMEQQIRDADFVLVICSEGYRQRVERREEASKGAGVVWEIQSIYTRLYFDKLVNKKFIPVLLKEASVHNIPVPLQGFNYYRADTENGYERLYRHLTKQPLVQKPPLGAPRTLPAKEKSVDSLPGAFSVERLSKTMSNPRYAEDLFRLDRIYDRHSVINKETIIIVVGSAIAAELLDRPAAELLRDHVDRRGGDYPMRRGIVITHDAWYDDRESKVIANNPVIAVGGPASNRLSAEFSNWQPEPGSMGLYTIPTTGTPIGTGFFRKNAARLPQVGLWGNSANATRQTVEHYLTNEAGFEEFLKMCWWRQ